MRARAADFLSRRRFLEDVGAGMLFAGLGPGLLGALDLRVPARLQDADDRLDCGRLEPLVRLIQETPADKILAAAVEKLKSGTALDDLVAAAALANARTFGGEDYVGFHCEMAMMPARLMAMALGRRDRRLAPLPVLKVLYRNSVRLQEKGGRERETLRRTTPDPKRGDAAALLAAERAGDTKAAEAAFAEISKRGPEPAYDAMQPLVRDNPDVHQVVLAWRAWDLASLVGRENAETMLRQSVRYCVNSERQRVAGQRVAPLRDLLPKLVDEHHLGSEIPSESRPGPSDEAVGELAHRIFAGDRDDAARATAAALGSGLGVEAVGRALVGAAVRLVLHDPGQTTESPGKPVGSVHGASIGVHASDSVNAWLHIASVTSPRQAAATLITAAWHTGGQSGHMDRENPMHAKARDRARAVSDEKFAGTLEEWIRARDQAGAAALVESWAERRVDLYRANSISPVLLTRALEDDGALHHEKFFATTSEAKVTFFGRPEYFECQAALARVVASGYGFEAPGLKEARERLLA